jgi:hypothetical protein
MLPWPLPLPHTLRSRQASSAAASASTPPKHAVPAADIVHGAGTQYPAGV